MCEVSRRTTWVGQQLHQLFGRLLGHVGYRARRLVSGHHPVNAPQRMPRSQVERFFEFIVDPFRVFDYHSIHVGNPETAIGTRPQRSWAKPAISAAQKLATLFLGRFARMSKQSIAFNQSAMNQVVDRFTDKQVVSANFSPNNESR